MCPAFGSERLFSDWSVSWLTPSNHLATKMTPLSNVVVLWFLLSLFWGSKPQIELVGVLEHPRFAHTTDRIGVDRFLLVGGLASEGAVLGSFLLDTSNGVQERPVEMTRNRHSHSSTVLCDGRILVVGGYDSNNDYLAHAEIFDPNTGVFRESAPLRVPRAGHTATRLSDCRVLVVGGVGSGWTFLSSAEIYDPETGQWATAGALRTARESHTATLMPSGDVLIAGGHSGVRRNLEILDSIERFDKETNAFDSHGRLSVRRHKHDAILLDENHLWVIGGSDERDAAGTYSSTELVNLTTGETRSGPPLHQGRYKLRGTVIKHEGGIVSILGGSTKAEVFTNGLNKSYLLDSSDLAGQFSTATKSTDKDVIIVGGYGTGMALSSKVWRFRLTE